MSFAPERDANITCSQIIDKQAGFAVTMARRRGHWLTARVFCILFLASMPTVSNADVMQKTATTGEVDLVQTLADLEDWLDINSPYPRRSDAPSIRFINRTDISKLTGRKTRPGLNYRGFYDIDRAEIHIVKPWSTNNPRDVSVLLHELVHHRQQTTKHWYCAGAQELPAYRLQEKWLAERGMEAPINWVAVVLEAGCSRRDVHPD